MVSKGLQVAVRVSQGQSWVVGDSESMSGSVMDRMWH